MEELIAKRRYNSKTFQNPDGTLVSKIHSGHIHYFDKLESGLFKDIDWTLNFDDKKRGWYFNTHSFRPFLPEYSTDWVEFRDLFEYKDQTVLYRAVCDKVIGQIIEKDDTNPNFSNTPGVLYQGAFGEGKDYLLYHTRSSLAKVATVNNPNDQVSDVIFEWEVVFPEKSVFRAEKTTDVEAMVREAVSEKVVNDKTVAYQLDITRTKVFDTAKNILIGNTCLDGKEWFTYIRSFRAWDSKGNTINISAELVIVDGKTILRKTIPLEFLKKAEGRVFTDATTAYTGTGDCRHEGFGGTWSTVRGQGTGQACRTGNGTDYAQSSVASSVYYIYRLGFYFDTSAIDDGDTVSAASVFFNVKTNSGPGQMDLVDYTPADYASPTTADYDAIGSTRLASTITASGTGWKEFALNASGISLISKTGNDGFAIIGKEDFDNSAPTNQKYWEVYMAETTGTSSDPYLYVTHAAGGTTSLKTINGIAIASVKSLNGIAIASVKSVNAIANA